LNGGADSPIQLFETHGMDRLFDFYFLSSHFPETQYQAILSRCEAMVNAGRAVLVFFPDKNTLEDFEASAQGIALKKKCKFNVLHEFSDFKPQKVEEYEIFDLISISHSQLFLFLALQGSNLLRW
jgi:hypothetical protein